MPPAARVTDMHTCPMVTGVVPHVGGPILPPCAVTVITGGMPQARVGDMLTCVGPPDVIAKGSMGVYVMGQPAARQFDLTAHGGVIVLGFPTVIIGEVGGGAVSPAAAGAAGAGGGAAATTNVQVPPEYLAKSPTLTKQIDQLEKDGWTIKYYDGPGSKADRGKKTIYIDKAIKDDPKLLTQTVSHEVGHALYKPVYDTSTRDKYLQSTLADEGAATMNNVAVQREIIANKGEDIGIAGNPANAPAYNKIMDQYAKDGDAGAARDGIGKVFGKGEKTSTTDETYEDYYGGYYDKNYAKKGP